MVGELLPVAGLLLVAVVVAGLVVQTAGGLGQGQVVWLGLGQVVRGGLQRMRVVTLQHVVTVRFTGVVRYLVVVWLEKVVTMLSLPELQLVQLVSCEQYLSVIISIYQSLYN